jgi:hypothetical protein
LSWYRGGGTQRQDWGERGAAHGRGRPAQHTGGNQLGGQDRDESNPGLDGEDMSVEGGKGKAPMDISDQFREGTLNQNKDAGKVLEVGEASGAQINEDKVAAIPEVQRESNQGSSNLGFQGANQRGRNGSERDKSFGVVVGKNQEFVFFS